MGEALSENLVKKGWRVAMADIQQNGQLASKLGDSASFHYCDVADYDSQAKAFQEVWNKYGRLDALCANAGIVDKRCLHSIPIQVVSVADRTSSIFILNHKGSDK